VPKKPWQVLMPGEPFDQATAPNGATVRDQVRGWGTEQTAVFGQLCCTRLCCHLLRAFSAVFFHWGRWRAANDDMNCNLRIQITVSKILTPTATLTLPLTLL